MATRPRPTQEAQQNQVVAQAERVAEAARLAALTDAPAVRFDGLTDKQNTDFNNFIDRLPADARNAAIADTQLPKNLPVYNNENSTSGYKRLIQNTWGVLNEFDKQMARDNGVTGDKFPTPSVDSFKRSMYDQTRADVNKSMTDTLSNNDLAKEIGFNNSDQMSERLKSYGDRIDRTVDKNPSMPLNHRRRVSLISGMLADDFKGAVSQHIETLGNPTPEMLTDINRQSAFALRDASKAGYDSLVSDNANGAAKPTGFINFLSDQDNPFHPSITDIEKNALLHSMADFNQGLKQDIGAALLAEKDNPKFNLEKTVDKIHSQALLYDRRADAHPALDNSSKSRYAPTFPANYLANTNEAIELANANPAQSNAQNAQSTVEPTNIVTANPPAQSIEDAMSELDEINNQHIEDQNRVLSENHPVVDPVVVADPVVDPVVDPAQTQAQAQSLVNALQADEPAVKTTPTVDSAQANPNIKFRNLPPDVDPNDNDSGVVLPAATTTPASTTQPSDDETAPIVDNPAPKAKAKPQDDNADANPLPNGVVRSIPIKQTPPRSELEILINAVSDNEYLSGKFDVGELDSALHVIEGKFEEQAKAGKPFSPTIQAAIYHEEMSLFMKGVTEQLKDEPNADGTKKNYLESRQVDVDMAKAVEDITKQHYKESTELMDYPDVSETEYLSPLSQEQVDAVRMALNDLPHGVKHHALSELKDTLLENPDFKFDDVVDSVKTSLNEYDNSYKTIRPEASSKLTSFSDTLQSKITESNKTAEIKTEIKPFVPPAPTPASTAAADAAAKLEGANSDADGDKNTDDKNEEEEDPTLTDEEKRERELQRRAGLGGGGGGSGGGGTTINLFGGGGIVDATKSVFTYVGKGLVLAGKGAVMLKNKASKKTPVPTAGTSELAGELAGEQDAPENDNTNENQIKRETKLSEDGTVSKAEHKEKVTALVNDLASDPANDAPKIEAPKVDDATPKVDDTTPKVDDATPKVDDTTPKVDDATPNSITSTKPEAPKIYTDIQKNDFEAVSTGMDRLIKDFGRDPAPSDAYLADKTNQMLQSIETATSDILLEACNAKPSAERNEDLADSLDEMTTYLDKVRVEMKEMVEDRGLSDSPLESKGSDGELKTKPLSKAFEETEESLTSAKAATAGFLSSFKLSGIAASIGGMFRPKGQ